MNSLPDLRSNFLSVGKMTEHGFEGVFRRNDAIVINPETKETVITAHRKRDLYYVTGSNEISRVAQVSCIKGKQTQKTYSKSETQCEEILELIHTDVCGHMRVESLAGSRYFVTTSPNGAKYTL